MARLGRVLIGMSAFALGVGLLGLPTQGWAEEPDPDNRPLTTAEAIVQARETGVPVEVSSLTDEYTLVTADPETGRLRAELTAGVARVSDGAGGWREPSAALVQSEDGFFRTEAGLLDVRISAGGTDPLVEARTDEGSVVWSWPDPLPQAAIAGDTATFAEVWPGVDLVLKAGIEQVETFLVVKDRAAAADPRVRSFSMPARYEELTPETLPNGAVELKNSDGEAPLVISPARMWDSTGAEQGAPSAAAIEEGVEAASAPVELTATRTELHVEADESLLDSSETVFPVTIDPSVAITRSYVVRVTPQFDTINDMTVDGKIGYNGWSSPYYKSRMFYQFHWPVNDSDQAFTAGQIVKGEFEYVQTHSPQHSPCKSSSSNYGPAVRVKLYNNISSSTTWPGPSSHPWSPVSSTYAVGHEDYCNDAYRQTWNITGMLKSERGDSTYSGRTAVTIGVYSADEGDKFGWRHYRNSSSENYPSPKLALEYEPEPPVPSAFSIAGAVSTSPWVTANANNNLNVKAALASGYDCRTTTACLKAEFTVKRGSTTVIPATLTVTGTTPGGKVTFSANGLTSGDHTATVRTYNVDTKLYSKPVKFAFKVALPLAAPTWSWVKPEGWSHPTDLKADTDLSIQVTPATGVTFCVYVNGVPRGGWQTPDEGKIKAGVFVLGTHEVSVAAKDAVSTSPRKADNPPQRTFTW